MAGLSDIFKFRYPKLTLLAFSALLAYYIFTYAINQDSIQGINSLGYLGAFAAGVLFSFGFTTPFAIGIFITIGYDNIFLTAIVGGAGALLSDLLIFRIIKVSFMDEFKQLSKSPPFKVISNLIEKDLSKKIKIYLLYAMAGIIIASPLPDEVGVSLLAGLTTIRIEKLAIISFLMNTLGIFILLMI